MSSKSKTSWKPTWISIRKKIWKWLDFNYTLFDLFWFFLLATLGLVFFRAIEPAYRSIVFWPLIVGILLMGRLRIYSSITAIIGAVGGAYWSLKYKIAWETTAPQFDDCLAAYSLIGASVLLSVHGLLRLRLLLAVLGFVSAYHSLGLFSEGYGDNSWFQGWYSEGI